MWTHTHPTCYTTQHWGTQEGGTDQAPGREVLVPGELCLWEPACPLTPAQMVLALGCPPHPSPASCLAVSSPSKDAGGMWVP